MFTFPRVMEAASKTSFCLILNDLDLESQQEFSVSINLKFLPSEPDNLIDNFEYKYGAVNTDGGIIFCCSFHICFFLCLMLPLPKRDENGGM